MNLSTMANASHEAAQMDILPKGIGYLLEPLLFAVRDSQSWKYLNTTDTLRFLILTLPSIQFIRLRVMFARSARSPRAIVR